ncbi:MAG: hypothetical protein SGILL_006526 [Bacillariaceae sp.]
MGIYWATYLCYGKFTDKSTASVTKKIRVASMDPMIEPKEWKAGVVNLSEIAQRCDAWKIKLEKEEGMDLFMEEGESCTYDYPPSSSSKFILVQRGLKFVQVEEGEE